MTNAKILIVDDTPKNIQLVASVLQAKEYDLAFATSGEDAITMFKDEVFDLVLLDVMMPGKNGFETCTIIKEHNPTIPVIFLTASTEESGITKGFEVGGQDYIKKPFNSKELLARVENHLIIRAYQKSLHDTLNEEQEKNKQKDEILLQQSKMAQMGAAFSMMTHQWKQPLGAMSALLVDIRTKQELDMLSPDDLDGNLQKFEDSIDHLSKTIETYTVFFKPKDDLEKVEIQTLIDKSLLLSSFMVKKSGTNIEVEIEPKNLEVTTLSNEIIQVFLVILQNSMDMFIEKERQGTIGIKVYKDAENYTVEIQDDAGGVSDEVLAKIFDLHFTTKGEKGSGIGLYMVKQIVTQHLKGTIVAKNKDKGLVVTITLPYL